MLESSVFWEAYRPVLKALQAAGTAEQPLPFEAILTATSAEVPAPAYLLAPERAAFSAPISTAAFPGRLSAAAPLTSAAPYAAATGAAAGAATGPSEVRMSAVFPTFRADTGRDSLDVLATSAWPVWGHGMDDSQAAAFKHALTHSVATVQGPPGTGKTWVGVQIARVLLDNAAKRDPRPIVFVCFTNHALDQFLERLLPHYGSRLVRVGGRSKSEALQDRSLQSLRMRHPKTQAMWELDRQVRERRRAGFRGRSDFLCFWSVIFVQCVA
jgi:hypothetical protein